MNKLQPLSSHSAFYYYHVQSFHVSSGLAVIAVTVQSLGIGWASALASIFFLVLKMCMSVWEQWETECFSQLLVLQGLGTEVWSSMCAWCRVRVPLKWLEGVWWEVMLPSLGMCGKAKWMPWAKRIGHVVGSREPQMFLAELLGDQLGCETLVMSAWGTAAVVLFKAHVPFPLYRFNGWSLWWGFHPGNFLTSGFHCQCYLVFNVLPPLLFGSSSLPIPPPSTMAVVYSHHSKGEQCPCPQENSR